MPSRARRRSSPARSTGGRRATSARPASPTTTNEAASTSIAAAVPPAATSRLPQTGPNANPSDPVVSTGEFACWIERPPPATTGTSANSAAWATRSRSLRAAPRGRRGAAPSPRTRARRRPRLRRRRRRRGGPASRPGRRGAPRARRGRRPAPRGRCTCAAIATPQPPMPDPAMSFARQHQRDERDAVAERREPDRGREHAQVALAHRPVPPRAEYPAWARASRTGRREAPGGRRVPDAEREAQRRRAPGRRRDARPTAREPSVQPNPVVSDRHRDGREDREHEERRDRDRRRRDRGEEQHADAGAAAHAVDEADPEGAERRPHRRGGGARARAGGRGGRSSRGATGRAAGSRGTRSARRPRSRRPAGPAPAGTAGKSRIGRPKSDERHGVPEAPPGAEPRGRAARVLAARRRAS